MRIKVSGEPQLVNDLRDHLRSVGCIAAVVGPDEVEATVPDAPSDEQELRELRAYLATWRAARDAQGRNRRLLICGLQP
jgi:hypothetical protein